MNVRFPVVPDTYAAAFWNQVTQQLARYFSLVVSQDEATPRIVLRSPGGLLYDVTVDDAGALQVTPTEKTRG